MTEPGAPPARRGRHRRRGGTHPLLGAIRALGTGVMAGVLAVVILIGIAAIAVPAVTGSTALTVQTSSMEPELPPGTLIVVRPTPVEEIAPGSIMTYQLRSGEATVVTHRVLEQHRTADGGYRFLTKGDANPGPDPGFVREVQVRGTLWYAIPWVGWVTQVVTGEVRAIVIPIAVVALGAYAAWMIATGILERSRERRQAGAARDDVRESSP
ncbi:signal peptidase I [Agrococcus sp. 1P02AA]|uniref:signal peptidase I n=1 Tax=Agrococcus sp. 1P02AA TaxID=3132259 RepID=UPI0039A53EFB